MNGFLGDLAPIGNNMALFYQTNVNRPEPGHCLLPDINATPVSHFTSHCNTIRNSAVDRHRANSAQDQQADGKPAAQPQGQLAAPVPAPRSLLRYAQRGENNPISPPVPAPRNLLLCKERGANNLRSAPVPAPRHLLHSNNQLSAHVPPSDGQTSAPASNRSVPRTALDSQPFHHKPSSTIKNVTHHGPCMIMDGKIFLFNEEDINNPTRTITDDKEYEAGLVQLKKTQESLRILRKHISPVVNRT